MKEQILKLREEGLTYPEIVERLGCSKSTVSYYCGDGQKQKTLDRTRRLREKGRAKDKPLCKKVRRLSKLVEQKQAKRDNERRKRGKLPIPLKHKRGRIESPDWRTKDLFDKIGSEPKCYLTGDLIDLNNGSSYHLDHIIPLAKGGTNKLDNIAITTRNANQAKSDMLVAEFIELCKKVLTNNGYQVS